MSQHVMQGTWVRTLRQIRNRPADLATGEGDPVPVSLPAGAQVKVARSEVQGAVRVEVTAPSGEPALLLLEEGEWEVPWDGLEVERPLGV